MLRNNMPKQLVLLASFTILLFIGTLLLKLDFSSSTFSTADIFNMFSPWTWIYLAVSPIAILLIGRLDKRISWIIPFFLIIVSCVIFTLVQYPTIFYSDTFAHGAIAKYIVSNGNISAITGYFQYPGLFIFTAIVSEIIGLPLLESCILIAAFFSLMITLLLFLIGRALTRRINLETEISWVVPTIFFAVDFPFFIAAHYSPQLMGLLMYIMFIYFCLKGLSDMTRELALVMLISFTSLTTVHIFSAAATVACVFCIYLIGRKVTQLVSKRVVTLTIFLMVTVLFILWHNFFAEEYFRSFISHLLLLWRGQRKLEIVNRVLPAGAYTLIFGVYRYGIYLIFAFTSFLGLFSVRNRIEFKLFLSLIFGVILETIVMYFTPVSFGAGRYTHYGGVIVSILSLCAIVNTKRKILVHFSRALTIILPFFVIATFLVSNAYYSTYAMFMHPDEVRVANFVAEHIRKQISIEIRDVHIIQFYTNVSIPILIIDSRSDNSTTAKMKIQQSELSFQYLPRQLYFFNLTFIENKSNLIYSNGLGRVYAKTDSPNR